MNRPRSVFGRRRVTVDGITYVVSLQADGVHVHQLHARAKRHPLTLEQLVALTERQLDIFAVGAGSSSGRAATIPTAPVPAALEP